MIKELIRLSECVIENDEDLIDSVNEKFLNISTYFNNIIKYSKEFGIGEKTGVDIPGELPGTLPTPEWKKKRFKNSKKELPQ